MLKLLIALSHISNNNLLYSYYILDLPRSMYIMKQTNPLIVNKH